MTIALHLQYSEVANLLEMLPGGPEPRPVSGLSFSSNERTFAAGGASDSIRLFNYDAVLAAGTMCAACQLRCCSMPLAPCALPANYDAVPCRWNHVRCLPTEASEHGARTRSSSELMTTVAPVEFGKRSMHPVRPTL